MKGNNYYMKFNTNDDENDEKENEYGCVPVMLWGLFIIIFITLFTVIMIITVLSPKYLLVPLTDKVPSKTLNIPLQFCLPSHERVTECTDVTCPIISLFTHQLLKEEYKLNTTMQQELSEGLTEQISHAPIKLLDGLYKLNYTSSHKYKIIVDDIQSVYSIEQAKKLMLKRNKPLLLTITKANNTGIVNGISFTYSVETGRSLHVTKNLVNLGIKTYCIVGWDDNYSGGGFIMHEGFHSMEYYRGNVSHEVEFSHCPNTRGFVDWQNSAKHGINELVDSNATRLDCANDLFCKLNATYVPYFIRPLGDSKFDAHMLRIDDKGSIEEEIVFKGISQYELESIFQPRLPANSEYCAYSFLTYAGFLRLQNIFVLEHKLDLSQYSVAFTAFNVTLTENNIKVNLQDYAMKSENVFKNNTVLPF